MPAELGWAYPIYTSLNPLYNKRIAEWNKSVSVAIDTFDFANKWFPWLKNPNWREAGLAWQAAMDEVLIGTKTCAEAMAEIKSDMDTILKDGVEKMETLLATM